MACSVIKQILNERAAKELEQFQLRNSKLQQENEQHSLAFEQVMQENQQKTVELKVSTGHPLDHFGDWRLVRSPRWSRGNPDRHLEGEPKCFKNRVGHPVVEPFFSVSTMQHPSIALACAVWPEELSVRRDVQVSAWPPPVIKDPIVIFIRIKSFLDCQTCGCKKLVKAVPPFTVFVVISTLQVLSEANNN